MTDVSCIAWYHSGSIESCLKVAGDKEIPFQTPMEEANAHP